MTCAHQRQCHSEGSETALDGGWIKLSAHTRQAETGKAGSRQARDGRTQTRRQVGYWGVRLLVAFVLVSASGARAFGAAPPPPADLGCSLTQVTSTIGGDIFRPAMNAAGTLIVFRSTASLTGENPGEIFLFDTTTTTFTQVTTGAGPAGLPSFRTVINATGTRIAFSANGNLTGANPNGNFEIFLFDTTTSALTQVTNTTGSTISSDSPTISGNGTRIAFISNADLTGENPDGNREVFLFDTTTTTFTQVTNTTGSASDSDSPAISGNGTRIAFISNADLTGGNPDGNREVFLFDTTTTTFTQVTNTTGSASDSPTISGNGARIAFLSNADLTGQNPDGNREVFLFDTTTTTFTQVTNTTGAPLTPSRSAAMAPASPLYPTRT